MDDALRVRRGDPAPELEERLPGEPDLEFSALLELLGERVPLEELEDEERKAGRLVDPRVEHLRRVVARDRRQGARLLNEVRPHLRVGGEGEVHQLESATSPGRELLNLVDRAGSGPGDRPHDAVPVSDRRSGGDRGPPAKLTLIHRAETSPDPPRGGPARKVRAPGAKRSNGGPDPVVDSKGENARCRRARGADAARRRSAIARRRGRFAGQPWWSSSLFTCVRVICATRTGPHAPSCFVRMRSTSPPGPSFAR